MKNPRGHSKILNQNLSCDSSLIEMLALLACYFVMISRDKEENLHFLEEFS